MNETPAFLEKANSLKPPGATYLQLDVRRYIKNLLSMI
jgi:hypothetical protein